MRVVLAICALACSLPAGADSWRATGSYFAVIVSDIERSADWYATTLGLIERTRFQREGRFRIVNLARDGLFVELIELADAQAAAEGRTEGPFKLGLLVDDIEAFAAALPAELEFRLRTDDSNGVIFLQLEDPDGNRVQVMQVIAD